MQITVLTFRPRNAHKKELQYYPVHDQMKMEVQYTKTIRQNALAVFWPEEKQRKRSVSINIHKVVTLTGEYS